LVLNSYAKLNLYLEVLNKRRDNYHNIKTIFERISLSDKIILKSRRDKKIKIICNYPRLPRDSSNLAYRAALLLQDSFKINKGIDIKIIKRIPVGSGLGGGSSNAAAILIGLNKLWGLNLTQSKLANLAENIGADVPFFIYNSPFAEGGGRGDKIKPLKVINNLRLWHILVVPKIEVSTALVYKKWDRLRQLTESNYDVKILILALKKRDLALMGKILLNNLERITVKLYPKLSRIKEKLIHLGLKSILMSGSGPAIFSVFSSRKEAVSLCRQLKREKKFWQVFVTRTI